MTSSEIRQSFLNFFKEKQHTIVPSASLLPQSPGLLFTNAGMNQFVPYFLGEQTAPYSPPRAADTQKCIRAGGKHNDLEDVGYDTYHHTLFEMLGNWSFGDYFKKEAINWAWELLIERWNFPPERLYATVYAPSEGDPSEFDQEAHDLWAEKFQKAGLDPAIHVIGGNVKDNFWMMGETGPCGPCSELHIDLTPEGDSKGALVNKDSDLCIELWNLVFIQFNAETDGSFRDLPAKHVDTGMGFERIVSVMQNTQNCTDFSRKPTNYNTDLFAPIFAKLEEITGKKYTDIYPHETPDDPNLQTAIAFRVIADHIRTLSLSIADGILPGNNGRNYVLRRILRRAVRYGRNLGLTGDKPFLPELVDTLAQQLGATFPELPAKSNTIKQTLQREEESFNQTLDRGLDYVKRRIDLKKELLEISLGNHISEIKQKIDEFIQSDIEIVDTINLASFFEEPYNPFSRKFTFLEHRLYEGGFDYDAKIIETVQFELKKVNQLNESLGEETTKEFYIQQFSKHINKIKTLLSEIEPNFPPEEAFKLYDTYGFPVDLTALLCRERGLTLDEEAVEKLMEKQRERARAAQKSETVAALDLKSEVITKFIGYEQDECEAEILELHPTEEKLLVITDQTPFYAEMGGQQGDEGEMLHPASDAEYLISGVKQIGNARAHLVPPQAQLKVGDKVTLRIHPHRRRPIEAHHTATHLLHWALHQAISPDVTQQGSLVAPDRLRFDFTSSALSPEQCEELENLVNAKIKEAHPVSIDETPYAEIKDRKDITQFFGDKYGEHVRVVQIGGTPHKLDGYSMELCGGTHVRNTSELELFKIKKEESIASGVRRIEALVGKSAQKYLEELNKQEAKEQKHLLSKLSAVNEQLKKLAKPPLSPPPQAVAKTLKSILAEAEKILKKARTANAASEADKIIAQTLEDEDESNFAKALEGSPALLQELLNGVKKRQFSGAAFFIVDDEERLHLGAFCSSEAQKNGLKAGTLIQQLAPLAGGKGGGKPDMARGAAPQREAKETLLNAAQESLLPAK